MTKRQRLAASFAALPFVFVVVVPVAVAVGQSVEDSVWLCLVSWAVACVWRDSRE